jgi:surface polysaccharide O-acyltransferase-like enzyme
MVNLLSFLSLTVLGAGETNIEIRNPLTATSTEGLITSLIEFLRNFAIVVTPLIVVVAGYLFMTAGGDPKKVEEAKKMIWYAVIGLIVILTAEVIIEAIKSALGTKQ